MPWTNWKKEYFAAGERIFDEGALGSTAYLIEAGQIEISVRRDHGEQVIATLGEGDLLGEIALIDQYRRTATATASTTTTLIPITRQMLDSKLNSADPLLSHMLNLLVERYRGMATSLSEAPLLRPCAKMGSLKSHQLRDFAIGQIKLAQDLSDAIEQESFQLHYQPIVRSSDEGLAGFEALIRWDRPQSGFMPPLKFIGLAEETGQIIPIGRWCIRTACRQLARFQEEHERLHPGQPPLFMSVNISATQLQEAGEADEVLALITESGVRPEQIKLEITETAIINDPENACTALNKFKALGLRLAIDDFGTGYSSLSYLERFPFDSLKIDRSFITTMLVSEGSQRIIRALVSLARELDMNCIAEGVELAEQQRMLRDLRCELLQGYHYAKPLPPEAVIAFIQGHTSPGPFRPSSESL